MLVRSVDPGGAVAQQSIISQQQAQILRTAAGQMVMAGGQRLVSPGTGGQVLMSPGTGGQAQVLQQVARPGMQQQQQLVRTSSGQLLVQQQQQQGGQTVIRQQMTAGGAAAAGVQRVVINQPGLRPGQPGSQITVPLSTLQALQPGQGIPTGTPGHLLVKTETGQYQILRVGPPGATGSTVSQQPQQQQPPAVRQTAPAPTVVSSQQQQPAPQIRLPTQPVAMTRPQQSTSVTPQLQTTAVSVSAPAASTAPPSPASSAGNQAGMGQQMTPDTAKVKCRNFLATLLRLASDQPDSVAKNVRELIQGLIESRIEPEIFTTKLQKELNSSPQPCLVPFLKKSLPYLQHSLATRELTIEGVIPPSLAQVGKLPSGHSPSAVPARPMGVGGSTVMRPAGAQGVTRPTFTRPALPTRPVQMSSSSLMPPPKAPGLVIKKSGISSTDDDINDVAAMGGVNIADENKKIVSAENVGSIIRSTKDTAFLQNGLLYQKVARICKDKGLDSPPDEVLNLISHATQERLKTLVSKLSVIAEHRLDIIRSEGNYEVSQDIKQQLRFLEELDRMEKKRHEEAERELLLRAAKSRTKTDDPEREKLKAKAKEIQRDEAERIRHEEANKTALEAIGGPKKRKFGDMESLMGPPALPVRSRTKRVHLRDVMFMMEQEKKLKHSDLLFRCYFS